MKKRLFAWLISLFFSLTGAALLASFPHSPLFYYSLILASGLLFYGRDLILSRRTGDKKKTMPPLREPDLPWPYGLVYLLLVGLSANFPWLLAFLPSLPLLLPLTKHSFIFLAVGLLFHFFTPLPYFYWVVLTLTTNLLNREAEKSDLMEKTLLNLVDDYEGRLRRFRAIYLESQNRSLVNRRNAVLEERNRIAREIHDTVGHQLTGTILQLAALEALSDNDSPLTPIRQRMEEALAQIRRSVHAMRDQSLSIEGDLQKLVENYSFCPVHLDIHIEDQPAPSLHYFIILSASEALQNTAKHSRATRFDINLKQYNDQYLLLLWDNGPDSDNGKEASWDRVELSSDPGMGLLSMKERVMALGGSIKINRQNGFHIFIQLPQDRENDKAHDTTKKASEKEDA